jgi:hypothetical protein
MHDIAAPPDQTLAPLWDRARARFARAVAAIGAPGAIAALRALTPTLRRAIVGWLAPLERIVRALLLAQAGAIARAEPSSMRDAAARAANVPPRACGSPSASSAPARDREAPETWPARFALSPPRDPRRVPDARAPRIRALWGPPPPPPPPPPTRAPRPRSEADGAFRLALRLEAVRRVLADPAPHALRLARLIARAVRRFPEIAARYLFAHGRAGGCDAEDPRLIVDVLAQAMDARYAFPDSS